MKTSGGHAEGPGRDFCHPPEQGARPTNQLWRLFLGPPPRLIRRPTCERYLCGISASVEIPGFVKSGSTKPLNLVPIEWVLIPGDGLWNRSDAVVMAMDDGRHIVPLSVRYNAYDMLLIAEGN